jgi:hypothetical protein
MQRMRINVDLPDELHRRLKSAAALEGSSIKDYLIRILEEHLPPPPAKPTKAR